MRRTLSGRWVGSAFLLAACQNQAGPGPARPTHDLVFEGYLTSTPELLMLDPTTGAIRRLLEAGTVVMDPEPSPDGKRIAFVVANYVDATGDVFVVNADGSGLTQLTVAPELDDQPSWSPDGTHIAFRSFRTQRDGDIWLMDADGGSLINLTPDPLPGVTDERRPAWSPNGARIAYASNAGGNIDLWTMAADGSDKRRITNSMELDTEPAWSPDGATIVFRRTDASGSDLYLVPVTGGPLVPLALPGEQRMPVWSPDGQRLVFVNHGSTTDRPDLYSMRIDGIDLRPLVTDAVAEGSLNPAFLPRP